MKIGIITTWFERGAAHVSKQYKALLEDQHDVFVYARGGEMFGINHEEWDGPFVTWGKRIGGAGSTEMDLEDFGDWITANRIDTLLFNEQHWWPAVAFARKMNVKIGTYVDYYTEKTIPYFELYDFLICNTHRHHQAFQWHPQAYYVPWGTETNIYKPVERKNREGLTFFHSAGMSPVYRKGTEMLLRAFDKLGSASCRLVIHTQVSLEDRLHSSDQAILAKRLSEGSIDVIEKTVGAPGLYHLGDVYVYPTRLEGIGLTIFEALSAGLPVILPDNAPMNEFINDGIGRLASVERLYSRSDGYYWPCCLVDIDDLANKMRYYEENFDRLEEFSQLAREHAVQYLNWRDRKEEVLKAFEQSNRLDVSLSDFSSQILSPQRRAAKPRFPWLVKVAKKILYR